MLTVSELAEYLGSSPSSVYRALRGGRVPCMKIGYQWRVNLKELQNWMASTRDGEQFQSRAEVRNSAAARAQIRRNRISEANGMKGKISKHLSKRLEDRTAGR
jgi:excisionase family DNA binding protein